MTDLRPQSAPSGDPLPQRGQALPRRGEPLSGRDAFGSVPEWGASLPRRGGESHPQSFPDNGNGLPQRNNALPRRGEPLPQRGEPLPQRNGGLPQRGGSVAGPDALPRRTRSRRAGRHRSPHRLSVAPEAPVLVIAVPGTAEADTSRIGDDVASIAGFSCPGVDIRVGYIQGDTQPLADCLNSEGTGRSSERQFPSVVVPLLLSPNPQIDSAVKRIIGHSTAETVLAEHLGPHPLVAEALHSRLAEAGLARHARAAGISISANSRGVVVLADIGEEAANLAAVAAVLLASRLSVPVVPASLGDPASIADAVTRLSESGAAGPALAPCLIGPEINIEVLGDLSSALGAPCAPPLGAQQAVGQLVAVRYGEALASLSVAG